MKTCPQCTSGYHDSLTTCPTHGNILNEIRDLKPGLEIRSTYRIVRKLGQGGMGTVYLADHLLMGEQRALKFLSPEASADQTLVDRLLREVKSLRLLHHPNVIGSGDLERAEDGSLFFPMEYVEGPDLRKLIEMARGPMPVAMALEIAQGITSGLAAAHELDLVHRDIKPENILMARKGEQWQPKIADFGIVALKGVATLTRTGLGMLTPQYAAPEQWKGVKAAELDGRTDLYALGCILYEMLTGRTPFESESYEGWMYQHLTVTPKRPSEVNPELARQDGQDELVMQLLEKEREKRPINSASFQDTLNSLFRPNTVRESMQPERRTQTAAQRKPSPAPKVQRPKRAKEEIALADPKPVPIASSHHLSPEELRSVESGLRLTGTEDSVPWSETSRTMAEDYYQCGLAREKNLDFNNVATLKSMTFQYVMAAERGHEAAISRLTDLRKISLSLFRKKLIFTVGAYAFASTWLYFFGDTMMGKSMWAINTFFLAPLILGILLTWKLVLLDADKITPCPPKKK